MIVREVRYDPDNGEVHMTPQLALPVDVTDTGETRLYRMTLPFLPPSKNEILGWPPAWQHSAKKKWERHIAREADSLMMPRGVHKIGMSATLVFATKNRRDTQNYAPQVHHWVPDALMRCGVLLDDREGAVEIGPNWGLKFAYDLRTGVPKVKRKRTVLAIAVRVGDGHE